MPLMAFLGLLHPCHGAALSYRGSVIRPLICSIYEEQRRVLIIKLHLVDLTRFKSAPMQKILALVFCFPLLLSAQADFSSSSGALFHQLHKLQNTTRVLYLAAHPDDENTQVIAWLENKVGCRTAYLSLTRGDGGQNLIGSELGAKLGILRSQELLQARAIDGGEQFFTRAVDFGYSKTAKETLEFWDKDKILSDVVRVIRRFQPDLIITRFPPDDRAGHGHHTASAQLALEAFDLAANPEAYPEQLQTLKPWQVKRLYWNHSSWWNANLDSIAKADPDYQTADVGRYVPVLGRSCNEIASKSRTQHKSQGFGVAVDRGTEKEYFKRLKGAPAQSSLFDDIPPGWARYDLPAADQMLANILAQFDLKDPAASVPALMALRSSLDELKDAGQQVFFRQQIDAVVAGALGLHTEITANKSLTFPGDTLALEWSGIQRSDWPVELVDLSIDTQQYHPNLPLGNNLMVRTKYDLMVEASVSQPYWLEGPYQHVFTVEEPTLIGTPENAPALQAQARFKIADYGFIDCAVPVHLKKTDRVEGEIIEPLLVSPPITASFGDRNLIFVDEASQKTHLQVSAHQAGFYQLGLEAPGWTIEPRLIEINAEQAGSKFNYDISIKPSPTSANGTIEIRQEKGGETVRSLAIIDYPHIDKRMMLEPGSLRLTKLDLRKRGEKVGYIMGAGDEVPQALRQMGYKVDLLDAEGLVSNDLSQYQAIIAGIRAYNTQEWLYNHQETLLDYVEKGGNYIVQYNTSSRWRGGPRSFGPYPFDLSRERVTEEDALVQFLLPEHPLVTSPNALSEADFENWIQERGLYFAGSWDDRYETPLAWHDQGEPLRKGGLLFASYGEGAFIYTGISFFRELPAGVEGAFRLMANLISFEP